MIRFYVFPDQGPTLKALASGVNKQIKYAYVSKTWSAKKNVFDVFSILHFVENVEIENVQISTILMFMAYLSQNGS